MKDKKIVVVFKTHFDIGFTELSSEVIKNYSTKMLKDVIKTCEDSKKLGKNKQYVWTMSTWPLIQSLKPENADAEDIKKAEQLIKEGLLTWHGLPFTTHTEFCSVEELRYGLELGNRLANKYGFKAISAKMTDVPGHTWILPQLLTEYGIKFLHLGCNPASTPPDVPPLFWWESPDGSRVLTFYNKGSYGSGATPPPDWKYPVWLALIQTNDNIGPQDASVITALEDEIKEKAPQHKMIVGRMDDFYNEIIKCDLDIPVIRKDLADSWIHGVGTYPKEVSQLRRNRRILDNLQKLNKISGANVDISEELETAYENALLFGEHTWGLDVKTHMGWNRAYEKKWFNYHKSGEICSKMELSWNEQRMRVNAATEATSAALTKIENAVISENSDIITIYNVSECCGEQWVLVSSEKVSFEDLCGNSLEVRHTKSGTEVKIEMDRGEDVKITAIKSYPLRFNSDIKVANSSQLLVIENTFYIVAFDKITGNITSFYQKNSGKEWVESSEEPFFGYRYDIYGMEDITKFLKDYTYCFYDWWVNDGGRMGYPAVNHQTFRPVFKSVALEEYDGEVIVKTTWENPKLSYTEYGNSEKIVLSVSLKAFCNKVDFKMNMLNKQETPFVEAGHVTFGLGLDNASYTLQKIGTLVDPSKDIIKDANNGLYCIDCYISATNGSNTFAVISDDTPLVSIGSEKIYKFVNEYREEKPIFYFNCFNNSWGTNFPQWIGGDLAFEFTVIADKEQDIKSEIENEISRASFVFGGK